MTSASSRGWRGLGFLTLLAPLKFVDPKVMLDENEKWTRLYGEIITRQAR